MIGALLCTGYSAFEGSCCEHETTMVSHDSGVPSHEDDHGCQCVCHQTLVADHALLRQLVARTSDAEVVFAEVADLPPDAVPLGIEHPPQIAWR